jgi:hypothetical protein
LLILDDASCDVLALLDELIPRSGQGLALVNTSIQPEGFAKRHIATLPIGSITLPESITLLRTTTGDFESGDYVYQQIATHVDCLPFALDLAGTFLKNSNRGQEPFTPRDYLESLQHEPSTVFNSAGSEQSIYRVISASLQQVQAKIDTEDNQWLVTDFLHLISFYSPENLPLDIMPFLSSVTAWDESCPLVYLSRTAAYMRLAG